jgi:hypothetical protein
MAACKCVNISGLAASKNLGTSTFYEFRFRTHGLIFPPTQPLKSGIRIDFALVMAKCVYLSKHHFGMGQNVD